MNATDDPYKVLGVASTATAAEIKKAYRRLALKFHPDKQSSESDRDQASAQFSKIAAAYEVLSDEEERKQYDMRKKHGGAPGTRYTTFDDSATPQQTVYSSSPTRTRTTTKSAKSPYRTTKTTYQNTSPQEPMPGNFHFSYDPSKVKSRNPNDIFKEVFGKDFDKVHPGATMCQSPRGVAATPTTPTSKKKAKSSKLKKASETPTLPVKPSKSKGLKAKKMHAPDDDVLSMSSSSKTVCHADGSQEVITTTTIVRKDGSTQSSTESSRSAPSSSTGVKKLRSPKARTRTIAIK